MNPQPQLLLHTPSDTPYPVRKTTPPNSFQTVLPMGATSIQAYKLKESILIQSTIVVTGATVQNRLCSVIQIKVPNRMGRRHKCLYHLKKKLWSKNFKNLLALLWHKEERIESTSCLTRTVLRILKPFSVS